MARVRRIIFNTLAAISLLLLLAVAGLWIDSYFAYGVLGYEGSSWVLGGMSDGGQCAILCGSSEMGDAAGGWLTGHSEAGGGSLNAFVSPYSVGFGGAWGFELHSAVLYVLVVPHWSLLLLLAGLPVMWMIKWRKRRRFGPNVCDRCAYDLTGNQTGICPECGASIGTSGGQEASEL